ncbi:hypothetical protein TIFTF001_048617 [Ficus carica]|uniref:Uncharacterized protein n=1 Tax=Ficus carica TaxID=3494 RepID=A0AA87YV45_FICCA|nr:hypothetical protein TIFTF001_048617 [Ficus carica]
MEFLGKTTPRLIVESVVLHLVRQAKKGHLIPTDSLGAQQPG